MPQPHLTLYGRDYVSKKRATTEAAFSDLKMIQSIAKTMTRKAQIPERKGPVSLNADSRKTEIFKIMKENHKLLDRLECLEPIVSTAGLLHDFKQKARYRIMVSHSKRLAGEYDSESHRIRLEDQAKTDAMNRSVQMRLTKYRMQQEQSQSMPSLTPLASTDPTGLSSAQPKHGGKPVVTKVLASPAAPSSSSKSVPDAGYPAAGAAAGNTEERSLKSQVSFPADINTDEPGSEWTRQGGPTPHPKKSGGMSFEDNADSPKAEAAAKEFDPAQHPATGISGTSAQESGAAAPTSPAADASYTDDFADQTQQSGLEDSTQG